MSKLTNSIIISDLHLTTNPRDAYRWGIWKHLQKTLDTFPETRHLFILGDLTEAKDFHSAHLVNGVVDNLMKLANRAEVVILRGNHDGIDPKEPYFRFLNGLDGVRYFSEPGVFETFYKAKIVNVLMVPHCDSLKGMLYRGEDSPEFDLVMAHFTVKGAASNVGNRPLLGISLKDVEECFGDLPIYSGDVHKPQFLGNVRYVGSPYHINFGDDFNPEYLVIDGDGNTVFAETHDVFPKRLHFTVTDLKQLDKLFEDTKAGDQLKVTFKLKTDNMRDWQEWDKEIKRQSTVAKVELVSTEFTVDVEHETKTIPSAAYSENDPRIIPWRAADALKEYCKTRNLARETEEVGLELFRESER